MEEGAGCWILADSSGYDASREAKYIRHSRSDRRLMRKTEKTRKGGERGDGEKNTTHGHEIAPR